ncbi:MAG: cyclic nucleotide-binding domain-containing protein [Chloroflexi bacterium]|nr:cyclic nucleotide-binding domain-containing protein [Chloroflexota bacterium]MDA1146896.1 cyclic nucleotide-binding domain-containing protein [Chloroflexota bacterium]
MTGSISREELLSGRLPQQRRARRTAGAIESRVLYMRDETRRALNAYFLGDFSDYQRGLDRNYFDVVRQRATSDSPLLARDLDRFAPQWRMLVPTEPELAAAVLRRLAAQLGLTAEAAPAALAALGADDPAVRAGYLEAFGTTPEHAADSTVAAGASGDHATGGIDAALRTVEDGAEWLTVPGGERLFAAGDPGDALYLVISGRFRVLQAGGRGDDFVAEIGRGEVVGEMGALTGEPRSAAVVAARDSEVIRIAQALLLQVAASAPEILLRINRDLVTRLRVTTANTAVAPEASSYAIIAASPGAPVREVARQLADAMGRIGPTALITQEQVTAHANPDAGGGPPVFTDPELIAWLAEQEASHRYVLYEGDTDLGMWTRRCIRQADRILPGDS